ncbi:MAG: hypothetical protein K1X53_08940 [Candidatus Sumerlaeaceae bacterium]|nr:hypothetical protein [Candidatus Sumerlaeaceae bacterium]
MVTSSKAAKFIMSLAAAAVLLAPMSAKAGCELPAKPCAPAPVCPAPCKQYPWWAMIAYYVPNRVLDLIDIGRLSIGIGCGFGVNVRVTELAEIGIGKYETTRFGMKGRVLPVYEENIDESGIAFLGWVNGCLQRDPTEIGADLHIGIIGAQAAVSLAEAIDFVAGFLLIDLQGDDLGPNPWD